VHVQPGPAHRLGERAHAAEATVSQVRSHQRARAAVAADAGRGRDSFLASC
jgi:hypothetical protein